MNTFRSALKRILAFIGLAPIRQVHALSGTVARADTKVDALKRRLATVHGELRTRKHEMKRLSRACDASERETREWQGSAERSKAKTAEWKVTAETWKQRAAQYRRSLRETKRQLESVEQTTHLAQEHLMSTEVKLDLVEAAIQTLDDRMRVVLSDGPIVKTGSSEDRPGDSEGE